MRSDIRKFIVIYVECFFVIIIMGSVLPNVLEYILNHFYEYNHIHQNSILVGGQVSKPLQIIYKYIYTFKLIVR
ncbi:MAG: hypothetical protein RR891_10130 [Clostridium sp.]|uniref:hypothetical protein n=1 Tax=Clostridium sp. TaxID=1506 RepID=UPI0030443052